MGRVTEVTLVFGLQRSEGGGVCLISSNLLRRLKNIYHHNEVTHKLLGAGEVKQLDEAEVVSGHQVEAGVRNTSTVDVGLLGVTRPNAENLVTQDAMETKANNN